MNTVHIRTASPLDAAALLDIYGPYVLEAAVSFDESLPSPDEHATVIAQHLKRFPWLVAEDDGGLLGYAYAGPHRSRAAYRWSVESTIYLHSSAHRKGLGRQLYDRLFSILRRQGFVQCYAGITVPNPASIGFHEAFGFRLVGMYDNVGFKHGQWQKVGWWEYQIQRPQTPPVEPIPFAELAG